MSTHQKKKRILLDTRQCQIFRKDMIEFGYEVSLEEIKRIAQEVSEGTSSDEDVIAVIMCRQIDEAFELAKQRKGR